MPTKDFRRALIEFNDAVRSLSAADVALRHALTTVNQAIEAKGGQLTLAVRLGISALAAGVALNLQEYAEEALSAITHATPAELWENLPEDIRHLLHAAWPEEGGLSFAGKIMIAAVSESFSY